MALTNFPNKIDSRDTNSSGDYKYNAHFEKNIDDVEYVMADDVNALQEAVMEIQKVIGAANSSDNNSLIKKINSINAASGTHGNAITSHVHNSNGIEGPSKINLEQHVQGKLPKANILLGGTNGLQAEDILLKNGTSLIELVNSKLSLEGENTISGDLNISGSLHTRTLGDWSANETTIVGTNAEIVVDNMAYEGSSVKNKNGKTGLLFLHDAGDKYRYGKYVISVRLKIENCTGQGRIGQFMVANYGFFSNIPTESITPTTGIGNCLAVKNLYATDFGTTYEIFYVAYEHMPNTANRLCFAFNWLATGTAYIDSIILAPLQTAVYDD